jgi:hypothetical protein
MLSLKSPNVNLFKFQGQALPALDIKTGKVQGSLALAKG